MTSQNRFQLALSKLDAFTPGLSMKFPSNYSLQRKKATIEHANMIITFLRNEYVQSVERLAKMRGSTCEVLFILSSKWPTRLQEERYISRDEFSGKLTYPDGYIECISGRMPTSDVRYGFKKMVISGKANNFENLKHKIPDEFKHIQDLCSEFDLSKDNDMWTFTYDQDFTAVVDFDVALAQAIILLDAIAPDYSDIIINYANDILRDNDASTTVQTLTRQRDHSKMLEDIVNRFQSDDGRNLEWETESDGRGKSVDIGTYKLPDGELSACINSISGKIQSITFDAHWETLDEKSSEIQKRTSLERHIPAKFRNAFAMCREFSRDRAFSYDHTNYWRPGDPESFHCAWCRISNLQLVIAEAIIFCEILGGFSN
jgi:hypothetical protein